ncbi:MAG: hypothetical protein PHT94_03670 [Candidatus Nanoarchaeia archaeon]|nr:hypothetical protein [Candidatus Nanoarchaeia archaeon]
MSFSKKSQVFILSSIIIIISFSSIIASKNILSNSNSFDKGKFFSDNVYLDLKDSYRVLAYELDENYVFTTYKSIILNQLKNLRDNDLNDELFIFISHGNKVFLFNYFKSNVKIITTNNLNLSHQHLLKSQSTLIINSFQEVEIYDEDLFIGKYSMTNPLIILNKGND